jgi:hypothetical protein
VSAADGIDLAPERQMATLRAISAYYAELPFSEHPQGGLRYGFENRFFSYADGIALYGMLRLLKPACVIEVGIGYSSALIDDVNERFFAGALQHTMIDPAPSRMRELLPGARVMEMPVQDVPLRVFQSLRANDILFIDSSHIGGAGSDVHHLLFQVLPSLAPGVVVHFHDVFAHFDYPAEWKRRGYDEAYLLRAFLQYNSRFKILLFNHWVRRNCRAFVEHAMPLWMRNSGGSLWLQA